VPGARFARVVVVPVPAIDPGLRVHVPVDGRPFNITLPVGAAQVEGCVIVPIMGAGRGTGEALMTTAADANEIHPSSLVT